MADEQWLVYDEWYRKVMSGKKYTQVMMQGNRPGVYRACRNRTEVVLFGIPASDLWPSGIRRLLPNKLDTSKFTSEELLELAQVCEEHQRQMTRLGYPIAARISGKIAEHYRSAVKQP